MTSNISPANTTPCAPTPIQLEGIRGINHAFGALRNLLLSFMTEETAHQTADRLEQQFGTVNAIFAASDYALSARADLSGDHIAFLRTLQTLFISLDGESVKPSTKVKGPGQAGRFLKKQIGWQPRRFLYAIYLNQSMEVIAHEPLCSGSEHRIDVNPRDVIQRALAWHAKGIILARNHPDGQTEPFEEERVEDIRIKEACDLLGIIFHDSFILTSHSAKSQMEEALANGEAG